MKAPANAQVARLAKAIRGCDASWSKSPMQLPTARRAIWLSNTAALPVGAELSVRLWPSLIVSWLSSTMCCLNRSPIKIWEAISLMSVTVKPSRKEYSHNKCQTDEKIGDQTKRKER